MRTCQIKKVKIKTNVKVSSNKFFNYQVSFLFFFFFFWGGWGGLSSTANGEDDIIKIQSNKIKLKSKKVWCFSKILNILKTSDRSKMYLYVKIFSLVCSAFISSTSLSRHEQVCLMRLLLGT